MGDEGTMTARREKREGETHGEGHAREERIWHTQNKEAPMALAEVDKTADVRCIGKGF